MLCCPGFCFRCQNTKVLWCCLGLFGTLGVRVMPHFGLCMRYCKRQKERQQRCTGQESLFVGSSMAVADEDAKKGKGGKGVKGKGRGAKGPQERMKFCWNNAEIC